MQFEAFSHPKARDLSVPADDVLLHIPGRLTAVFDGATDSQGRRLGGIPVGRAAAMAAAHALADLPPRADDWPVLRVLGHLSDAVGRAVPVAKGEGPASTTAMIAFETDGGLRLVGIGDTGYRIDGTDPQVAELAPDRVSIPARVRLFEALRTAGHEDGNGENLTRRIIGTGFDAAVVEGLIPHATAEEIVAAVIAAENGRTPSDTVSDFLRRGLRHQHVHANTPDSPLGYGVLNGTPPVESHVIDRAVPRSDWRMLEIFSDGYLASPADVSIAAWEDLHAEIESTDPQKVDRHPAVKGSTDTAFFDDRTIAILRAG